MRVNFYDFASYSITNSYEIRNPILQQPSPLENSFLSSPAQFLHAQGQNLHTSTCCVRGPAGKGDRECLNTNRCQAFPPAGDPGTWLCHWGQQKKSVVALACPCVRVGVNDALSAAHLQLQPQDASSHQSQLWGGVPGVSGLWEPSSAGQGAPKCSVTCRSLIWGTKLAFGFDVITAASRLHLAPSCVAEVVLKSRIKRDVCLLGANTQMALGAICALQCKYLWPSFFSSSPAVSR